MKPRALDLFCKAGGVAKGLQRAGFHVTGVDVAHQPRYAGDVFHHADANEFPLAGYDLLWASPPCQKHSDLAKRNGNADAWPCFIASIRERFIASGLPYCIENVAEAPLIDPVILCGTMFPGLRVLRHRGFEANFAIIAPPHGKHPLVFTHDKRKRHYGRLDQATAFVQVTGGGNCSVKNASAAMGIDWMTKDELNEAIPPAFSEHIGRAALAFIEQQKREAA